jgi:hypothetical protein
MAREPREPGGPDGRTDDRQNSWEETAFGAPPREHDVSPAESGHASGGIEDAVHAVARHHAEELGEALHAKFLQLLTDKVRGQDGQRSMDDVAEMSEAFRAEIETIEARFIEAVESITLSRTPSRKKNGRSQLFHRLMTRNFEDRFADESALRSEPDRLSRRILPGFFTMLSLMLGKPELDAYEKQMNQLVDRLGARHDGTVDWAEVYRSPEARNIALKAEIDIAKYFANADKRLTWMIALINSNLIPPPEYQTGEPWKFEMEAAEKLLAGLFSDVRTALSHAPSRQTFVQHIGADTVSTLDKVTERFN